MNIKTGKTRRSSRGKKLPRAIARSQRKSIGGFSLQQNLCARQSVAYKNNRQTRVPSDCGDHSERSDPSITRTSRAGRFLSLCVSPYAGSARTSSRFVVVVVVSQAEEVLSLSRSLFLIYIGRASLESGPLPQKA